jgi:hypothetical protein
MTRQRWLALGVFSAVAVTAVVVSQRDPTAPPCTPRSTGRHNAAAALDPVEALRHE